MIIEEKNKLEKALIDALKYYWGENNLYLVIEDITFHFDYEDDNDYTYSIKGRYGREVEEENLSFNNSFKLEFLDKKWSLDFIKGYFYAECVMEK